MYGVRALCGGSTMAVVDGGWAVSHHEAGRRFVHRPSHGTEEDAELLGRRRGYRRTKPVKRPKLDGFTGIVDANIG